MKIPYLAYLSICCSVSSAQEMAHVLRYIPEDVQHHYNFIDPKVKWLPDHKFSAEDFKPAIRDVTRKKTHEEIKRIAEHKIHKELIPDEEHVIR
jgi:hypothetical protein